MPRPISVRLSLHRPCLIGVVHLRALPGAPCWMAADPGRPLEHVLAAAVEDARALAANGCDALIVENFGDVPFHPTHVPPETIAAMALSIAAVRDSAPGIPVGVNVLRNDARAALGLCAATGAEFLRVNVHAGAAVTDQGLVEGRAFETLRERTRIAPGVAILADAHVKHATQLSRETLPESVEDLVHRALCDGVIVSGSATGRPPEAERVRAARAAAGDVPVLIGSGLDERNAHELLAHATGAIVGTALKVDGRVANPVDPARVRKMRAIFDAVRLTRP
ncbi:MAG: BtpA/SgcQ family protein [Planctomycetota bacterium]|nr:BtpA/SgcQ family protein [Planctomycetota bacterium]